LTSTVSAGALVARSWCAEGGELDIDPSKHQASEQTTSGFLVCPRSVVI
jgi:hypothetical protein